MGLYNVVQMMDGLPESFENDSYTLDDKMIEKYKNSKIGIVNGQMRGSDERFCKNTSVFDVTGRKLVWGDIAPGDVEGMLGVYYLLSEHKSFWDPDKVAVKNWGPRSEDPYSLSPFRNLLPTFEPVIFDIAYVKKNAFARIVDGRIETSKEIISNRY